MSPIITVYAAAKYAISSTSIQPLLQLCESLFSLLYFPTDHCLTNHQNYHSGEIQEPDLEDDSIDTSLLPSTDDRSWVPLLPPSGGHVSEWYKQEPKQTDTRKDIAKFGRIWLTSA